MKIFSIIFLSMILLNSQTVSADAPTSYKSMNLGSQSTTSAHDYNWIRLKPTNDPDNPSCDPSDPNKPLGMLVVDTMGVIRVCGNDGWRNTMDPWIQDGFANNYIHPDDPDTKVAIGIPLGSSINDADSTFHLAKNQTGGSTNYANFVPVDTNGNAKLNMYVAGDPVPTTIESSVIYLNFLVGARGGNPYDARISYENSPDFRGFIGLNFYANRKDGATLAVNDPELYPDLRLYNDGRVDFGTDITDPTPIRDVTSTHTVKVHGDIKTDNLYLVNGILNGEFQAVYVPAGGKYYATYGP